MALYLGGWSFGWLFVCRDSPDQTRPDQTRPDQTRPDQTRPDQTRPVLLQDPPGKGKEDTVELTLGPGAAVQETPGAGQWRLRLELV